MIKKKIVAAIILRRVQLDVATVATFNTQNVATLHNFNPLKFIICMLSFTIQSSTYLYI